MRAHDMRAVLVRLTETEHALLQTILREEAFTMQAFFRQAAKRRIRQHAQAVSALDADECDAPAHENAPPGANR